MKDTWPIIVILFALLGWGGYLAFKYIKPKLQDPTFHQPTPTNLKSIEDESIRQLKAYRQQQRKTLRKNMELETMLQQIEKKDFSDSTAP